jgi:LmeA-like phospholipid-binding
MRSARRLVAVLVIVTALLVGADFAARALAQSVMADRLRAGQQLAATPTVSVSGWPFLTQALRGSYDEIVVTSPGTLASTGATAAGVPALQHLEAHLRQVTAPLSLLNGGSSTVRVGSATATATVTYAQLASTLRARIPELTQIQLSDGGNGAVAVRAVVTAYRVTVPLQTTATVTLSGEHVTVRVDPGALAEQSPTTAATVTKLLTVSLTVPRLPYSLAIHSVRATADGIEVSAQAAAVALQLH